MFTLKKDRLTLLEKEKEALKKKQEESEAKKKAEERRRQTLKVKFSNFTQNVKELNENAADFRRTFTLKFEEVLAMF